MNLLALLVVLSQSQTASQNPESQPPPDTQTDSTPAEKATEATVTAAPAAAEPAGNTAEPAPEPNPWTAGLSFGITWISGNVSSLSAIGGAQATRKTERTIWASKLGVGYGEKYGPLPSEVLLYNGFVTSQFDLRFNSLISAFVGGGLDFDHVKSVELRGYGEIGVGFAWFDRKFTVKDKEMQKFFLKTDLSARLQPEQRFQYYPVEMQVDDVLVFGPRLAAALHYAFTENAYFHDDLELLPNVLNKARLLLNNNAKVGVNLFGPLAVTVAFGIRYDSEPAAGKQPLDTVLTVGLEANL
ncbi:MAG: DUF481 domain-containing protein [Archangiaceae bacterium]|nr:DUF481 domain-containing protein [Archangiaceae bacterium]